MIGTIYSIIARTLWSGNELLINNANYSFRDQSILKRRREIIKMLIVCVCAYFLCYSAIQIRLFFPDLIISMEGIFAMNALTYANSAVNPIIYTVFSRKFRRRFKELLICIKKFIPLDDQSVRNETETIAVPTYSAAIRSKISSALEQRSSTNESEPLKTTYNKYLTFQSDK